MLGKPWDNLDCRMASLLISKEGEYPNTKT